MPGLGKTTARLAGLREAMRRASESADDAGLTEVRGFGFNPGGLRMLTYMPEGLADHAPLVVVLHGCTQRAGSHARAAGWLTLADRLGFAVLAPEQDDRNNPNRCFNWFEPGDIQRDAGEAASIHAMIQHVLRSHRLDADRVFLTGLSAGGAMTAVLMAAYPEAFAAGAVVAGLPFGVAANVQEAFAAMRSGVHHTIEELAALVRRAAPTPERRPRLSVWHGQADGTVASANALALARQWAAVHGLPHQPSEVWVREGRTRSLWRGGDGEAVVEMNLLAGLGHGAAVTTRGDDPIGEVAAFMLEAGVSSSLEIARFWGLAPEEAAAEAGGWTAAVAAAEPADFKTDGLGASVMASVSPHVSDEVREVIAKALAAGGLMR